MHRLVERLDSVSFFPSTLPDQADKAATAQIFFFYFSRIFSRTGEFIKRLNITAANRDNSLPPGASCSTRY